ncbi:MAG: HisA/HisF-related TIM barrel protein [Pseudomonadota bacterium]
MILIPEIYIKNGKAVSIGENVSVFFNEDPLTMAINCKDAGCESIYVIDTSIPATGGGPHLGLVKEIQDKTQLRVLIAGGIRSLSSVKAFAEIGVELIILGTIAYQNKELLMEACKSFPGKIATTIDVRTGRVTIPGWTVAANKTQMDFAKEFREAGVLHLVYSDLNNEGAFDDESTKRVKEICSEARMRVLLRSGINSIPDLENLIKENIPRLDALILANPLYNGDIDLRAANSMLVDLQREDGSDQTITEM